MPKKIRKKATTTGKPLSLKPDKDGVVYAAIDSIEVVRNFNVRKNTKPEEELINSIKANGVIHPIHVRWKNRKKDVLLLIDGERRLNAAMAAELGSLPIVHHGFLDDKAARIISLTANENQKRLTAKERLEGFKMLVNDGLSAQEIARVMAVDKRTVAEALRVEQEGSEELKKAAQKGPKKGGVAPRVAARAAGLPKKEQKKVLPKIKGKPTAEGLKEVRNAEKKIGVKRPGQKAVGDDYTWMPGAKERCQQLENLVEEKRRHAMTHKGLNKMRVILLYIKGHVGDGGRQMTAEDVFKWDAI